MDGYTLDLSQRLTPDTFKNWMLTEITSQFLIDKFSNQSELTTGPMIGAKQPHLKRWQSFRLYLQALGTLRDDRIDEPLGPIGAMDSLTRTFPHDVIHPGEWPRDNARETGRSFDHDHY